LNSLKEGGGGPTAWRTHLLALPVAAGGGLLAYAVHMPLPWVLGAMLAVAAASLLMGRTLTQKGVLRRAAQGCIGLAIGLAFTPATWGLLGDLTLWIVLAATTALVLSVLAAPVIQRLAGMDGPTAIYAVALGASSEMALQAQRAGADGASVACAHAVRIIMVTGIVTFLAWMLGQPIAASTALVSVAVVTLPHLLLLLAAAMLLALLIQRQNVPNPWLLGPLIVGGLGAMLSWGGRLPDAMLIAAQVMIGWALGQNITRSFFSRAPRVLACAALVTLGILAACLTMGWLISWGSGLPLMTTFIALAPGGMAEMGVIAKTFGLGAPLVTAFHIVRIVSTVFLTQMLARWMLSSGWVRH